MIKLITIMAIISNVNITHGKIDNQSALNNIKYNHVGSYVIPYRNTDNVGDPIIIVGSGDEYITHFNIK